MAPLPENNTGRLIVDYTTGRNAHSFQLRVPGSQPMATNLSAAFDFLDVLVSALPTTWTVTGTRFVGQNEVITLPVAPGILAGFTGSGGALAEVDEPREFVWVGRTPVTGRRWELSLYGVNLVTPADYRYETAGMPPSLQAAITTLTILAQSGTIIGIDGSAPIIYPYVNVNYNSHWESKARR